MPPPRWRWGLQYVPFGWVPQKHPWGAAPRCPACPAGVPISPEKWGERGPGASPLDPRFLWPLVPTRWVWGWLALVRSKGCCLRYAKTDLGRIFRGKICWKAFLRKKVSKSGASPQSLPLGGRTVRGTVRSGPGEATINHRWAGEAGSDEGAIWYPTFPCRKEVDGSRLNEVFLLPRWATRSPPHQSPSVTASPQGEASGLCSPTRKKRPKSGHVHGHRTSPTTVPLRPATPKRASANERPLTQGGRGPSPATLCVRAFSRESLDPPPGTGRETTSQVPTCAGPSGSSYR